MCRSIVLLPEPLAPMQGHHFPALDIEIDTIQYTAAAIADSQIADGDDRIRHDYPKPSM